MYTEIVEYTGLWESENVYLESMFEIRFANI